MPNSFSEYIVFVDESGDHNLEIINKEYPVFVLAFCVFKKDEYVNSVCPKVQDFKLRWFGHDSAILHEREIRKDHHPFQFLKSPDIKREFMEGLSSIIAESAMTIIPTVIRKEWLKKKYARPDNPYHLALLFCIERLANFLEVHGQEGKLTHIIFEQRGGKAGGGDEDRTLELEFRRIMDGKHYLAAKGFTGMEMEIIPKASNSIGLQLADLVARPIGLKCMRPLQDNKAFDIIHRKFMHQAYAFAGMKTFP